VTKKQRKPPRASGRFAAGPDERRHQWTAESHPEGAPFALGPDPRRNPGGRPRAARELTAFAQDLGPALRERVKLMLLSPDDETAMWAIEYLTKWGAGAPPKKPRGDVDAATSVEDLELLLAEEAMEGDRAAILALLAAKDPERYGRHTMKKPGDDGVDTADTDVPAWTPRAAESPT
jgi:hypothetical protein